MILSFWLLGCSPSAPAHLADSPAPRADLPVLAAAAPPPGPDPVAVLARETCDRYVATVFAERNHLPGQAPPPSGEGAGGPGIVAAPGTPQVPLGPAPGGMPAFTPPPASIAPRIAPDCTRLDASPPGP